MKYESRKNEKDFYVVRKKPTLITVPPQNFITIEGEGDPNQPEFSDRVGALYSIAFPIKMNYKFSFKDNPGKREHVDFDDFMVFPLEGVWSSYSTDATQKDQFKYKIMIRQPYFVTEDMFKDAIMSAKEKLSKSSNGEDVKSQSSDEKTNKLQLLNQVKFETMEDSLCVHMLHQGPFDDEPESFAQMDEFTNTNNLKRLGKEHREIYLGDFRRTKPENLKTILRYKVEKA